MIVNYIMVSLKDVAKACNLSVTQVSRALNGHSDVSQKSKELVLETAKKMGYIKNMTAQRLVTRESNQIAIIFSGLKEDDNRFSTSFLFEMLKGVNDFALTVNYEPVIHIVNNSDTSYVDFCKQRNIPGAIVVGMKYDDYRFQELINSEFPCVAIDIQVEGKNKGCVVVNNYYYSMSAVNLMIQKGRKHIGIICGHEHAMVTNERKIGYQAALTFSGIEYDPNLVVIADFDYDKAYEMTKKLIENNPHIDGLFCVSDVMAMGSLKAINDLGKRVPDDIALFGFDGIALTEFSTPPISTIKQFNKKKGMAAAKLLYEILHHTNEENTVVIPCEILVRESV